MSVLYEDMNISPELIETLKRTDPGLYAEFLVKLDAYEVACARDDAEAFCKYVLRDEQTGLPLKWAEYHSDYIKFLLTADAAVVFGHVEMGKTQLGIGVFLWMLGRNPNLRILLLNATATISERTANTMRMHIENNPYLHKVFPNLKPGVPWTDQAFCVQRRPGISTASVVAAGVGSSIISFRFDIVWGDDIVNNENTQTAYLRQKTLAWFQNSPMSRTSRGMRVIITVNMWHREDAAHMLARLPGWTSRTYPVGRFEADGSITPYWPAHWDVARIRMEMGKRTPAEGMRAFFCVSYGESASRVDSTWFEAALKRGIAIGEPDVPAITHGIQLLPGEQAVIGVDIGLSDKEDADLSSLTFLGMRPPVGGFEILDYATVAKTGLLRGPSVRLFGFQTGRMLIDKLFALIVQANFAFSKPPIIFVESVQAQRWLVDIISKSHPEIQIYPFLTRGRGTRANKNHVVYGVEGLFRALATGEVDINSSETGEIDTEIGSFIDECRAYTSETHAGDRLMSTWIGYVGGLAYMMEQQIGYAGVDDIYGEAEHVSTEVLSPEEMCANARQAAYDGNAVMVQRSYADMLDTRWDDKDGSDVFSVR